jgi:DegV family protein with EDD domain
MKLVSKREEINLNKIAIITDTTCDLPNEIIKQYNINVLPFRIIYKDKEYRDKLEITPEQVYNNFVNEIPTSSMPSMDDMEKMFQEIEEKGYEEVIAIVLSTGLSGIYNGIQVVSENHPNLKTFICDSQSISMGEGALVVECGKMVRNGKSFNEIVDAIPSIKKRIHLFFVVGTLEYLKKGGRIGKVSGTIAELLNIKPIISIDTKDGKYFTYDKVRGKRQALNKLMSIGSEILNKSKCSIYVMHGNGEEEAKKVYMQMKNQSNVISSTWGGCISPVSGVHSGPGLIGLVLVEEPN